MSFGAIDLQSIYQQRLETLLGHVNKVSAMKTEQDKAEKARRKKAKAEAKAENRLEDKPKPAPTVTSSKDLIFRRYRSSDQEVLQTFVQTTPKTYAVCSVVCELVQRCWSLLLIVRPCSKGNEIHSDRL